MVKDKHFLKHLRKIFKNWQVFSLKKKEKKEKSKISRMKEMKMSRKMK